MAVLTLALALLLVSLQLVRTNMMSEFRASLDLYLTGEANRPFAYRVLIPALIDLFDSNSPYFIIAKLNELAAKIEALSGIVSGIDNEHPRAIIWLALLQLASLVGYAWAGSELHKKLFPGSKLQPVVAPLLLAMVVPFLGQKLGHVYDFSVLFFMMMLLLTMYEGEWTRYIIVFALACLNKETAILATIAYGSFMWGRIPLRNWVLQISTQAIVFITIYGTVRWLFRFNPGSPMEFWLYKQIPYYWDHLARLFVFMSAALWLTIRLPKQPEFLRRVTPAMVLPQIGLVLMGATPGEVRNLYEILPVVSMFLLADVEIVIGRKQPASRVRDRPSGAQFSGNDKRSMRARDELS